jgi:DNA-binding transcriptional MerR regulator
MDGRRLIGTAELAKALGVSTRTIQRYRAEGLITPAEETLGGRARWIEADVREQMRLIREQRRDEQDE